MYPANVSHTLLCPVCLGVCDAGDKCDADGECIRNGTDSYKGSETTCRTSAGPCDKADTCEGSYEAGHEAGSYKCTEDKKFGDQDELPHTCRPACESCPQDVPEVCPGGTNDCPANVVMESQLYLVAGQNNDAGTVSIKTTESDDGSEINVCATIELNESWQFKDTDNSEAIKLHMCNANAPQSNTGRYDTKYSAAEYAVDGSIEHCETFAGNSTMLYMAFHLDVKRVGDGDENSETAWALATSTESATSLEDTTSPFTEQSFPSPGTRKGPKTSGATTTSTTSGGGGGWGKYITTSVCDTPGTCREPVNYEDDTTTIPPPPAPLVQSTWTCTSGENSVECSHSGAWSATDTCGNLFG